MLSGIQDSRLMFTNKKPFFLTEEPDDIAEGETHSKPEIPHGLGAGRTVT